MCRICNYACSLHNKETIKHVTERRRSPNYNPKINNWRESVVLIMQKGHIFGVEDAFVENPKEDKTDRYYT